MSPLEQAPDRAWRYAAAGLGAIFLLHVVVLVTTNGPMGASLASKTLQAISMALAAFFAGRAALRSRDFGRHFWVLACAGFVMLLTAFLTWHVEKSTAFGANDFIFLLHMLPFGLALLLNDRPGEPKISSWPILLDYAQLLMMVVILFAGFIYIPSRGATEEQMQALYRAFAAVFVTRNVIVTGGFWARALLSDSQREALAFRTMGIYLFIYTAGSAAGHYVFLSVHPTPAWLDLQGSVPALSAAWLFSQWHDLPAKPKRQRSELRSVLTVHLIPSLLPIMVAALASSLGKTDPKLAWVAVSVSLVIFALRLLVTIYSEHRAGEAQLQAETRYQSLFENNLAGVFRSSTDGRLLDCNQAFTEMCGYTCEELRGLPSHVLYPGGKAQRDAMIADLRQARRYSNFEMCFRRKDGSLFWVLQNVALGKDEQGNDISEGTVVDITARKTAEMEIAKWKRRYEAAVLASGQILFDWDPVSRTVTFGGAL
jgi:PAS domain S-box-containing protein